MKVRILLWLAMILAVGQAVAGEMRVLTWNIHHGEGADGRVDLERVAKVIMDQKPDVVLLQEVDRECDRSGKVDQIKELSRLTGMHGVFGEAMPLQGGGYGLGILSKFPIAQPMVCKLPGKNEPRILFYAVVQRPEGELVLANAHLEHTSEQERHAQAQMAFAELSKLTGPAVFGGDLNDGPGSKTVSVFIRAPWDMVEKSGDKLTCPADAPKSEIDFLFARGLVVKSPAVVIAERVVSDHRPVLAVME